MGYAMGIFFTLLGACILFLAIPYSGVKSEFKEITADLIESSQANKARFTEDDIADLPAPVQRYFRYTRYIGQNKFSYAKASYTDVNFSLGRDKPSIIMDYTHFNFSTKPARVALIDSSLYKIPFQGIDSYHHGKGSMKGVLAKLIPVFNEQGPSMDRSSLATFLSECLLFPTMALEDYVVWESIDDLHARASMTYAGVSASGMFTFNETGEMLSFTTLDREAIGIDGTLGIVKWTAACDSYREIDGIMQPTNMQAIWNHDDGDFVYFNTDNITIERY